jgi:hypothetical protein
LEESIERHSWAHQPNSGVPEFGDIIVQLGNSRLGRRETGNREIPGLVLRTIPE